MASFEKGHAKIGGRKPGSKNKLKKVADILAEKGIKPVDEILKILLEKDAENKLRPAVKADLWLELLSYCQAKPKEAELVDDDDDEDGLDSLTDAQLLKLVKDDEVV